MIMEIYSYQDFRWGILYNFAILAVLEHPVTMVTSTNKYRKANTESDSYIHIDMNNIKVPTLTLRHDCAFSV